MFGRYFHALTCHAPLLYRIISPRLLNTESEERMFGQCKSITRSTSNHHANHIITNILVRIHEEQKYHEAISSTIKKQNSEVEELAKAIHRPKNTVIPHAWLNNASIDYQAHLERIGDYLLEGRGMWWDYIKSGVEFYDIQTPNHLPELPEPQHFRTSNLGDIELHLLLKWEQCCMKVELPAVHIRTYTHDGSLSNCISSPNMTAPNVHVCATTGDQPPPTLLPTPVPSVCATTGDQPPSNLLPTPVHSEQGTTGDQTTPTPLPTPVPNEPATTADQPPSNLLPTPVHSGKGTTGDQPTPTLLPTPVHSEHATTGDQPASTLFPIPIPSECATTGDQPPSPLLPTPVHSELGTTGDQPTSTLLPAPVPSECATTGDPSPPSAFATPSFALPHSASPSLSPLVRENTTIQVLTTPTPIVGATLQPQQLSTPNRMSNAVIRSQLFVKKAPKHLPAETVSTLAKSLLTVLPGHMEKEILTFAGLRSKIKESTSSTLLPSRLIEQYKHLSIMLRDMLIQEFYNNIQALQRNTRASNIPLNMSDTENRLCHKVKLTKRILAHEWKSNTDTVDNL